MKQNSDDSHIQFIDSTTENYGDENHLNYLSQATKMGGMILPILLACSPTLSTAKTASPVDFRPSNYVHKTSIAEIPLELEAFDAKRIEFLSGNEFLYSNSAQSDISSLYEDPFEAFYSIQKLMTFSHLPHGWNGYNASPVPASVVEIVILRIMESPLLYLHPEVFPTARESVQVEIENESGEYLELEFFDSKTGILYEESGRLIVDQEEMSWEEILTFIEKFRAK